MSEITCISPSYCHPSGQILGYSTCSARLKSYNVHTQKVRGLKVKVASKGTFREVKVYMNVAKVSIVRYLESVSDRGPLVGREAYAS